MTDRLETFFLSKRDHPVSALILGASIGLHPLLVAGVHAYMRRKARNGKRLPRPVISVGNITAGGTGKTSMVRLLLEYLRKSGFKAALLYRGYKRKSKGQMVLRQVTEQTLDPRLYGDEPYMVWRRAKDCGIFINEDRYEAGLEALRVASPDIFILDDGFQHVSLRRDLEIVLVDSIDPFGNGRLLPFGLLREPLSALRRADLIVLTRCNQSDLTGSIETIVSGIAPSTPILKAAHTPYRVLSLDGEESCLEDLRGRKVYIFSGIGNHSSFVMTAGESGACIMGHKPFADHHWYSENDMTRLFDECRSAGAESLLTTEKDLVRIPQMETSVPLRALLAKISILSGAELLWSKLGETLKPKT